MKIKSLVSIVINGTIVHSKISNLHTRHIQITNKGKETEKLTKR